MGDRSSRQACGSRLAGRRTQRSRRNLAVALALLMPVLPISGCSLESPESPRWTVDLTVPLVNRHYDIPYIISHAAQEELIWDSVSGARFEVRRTLDTIFIGDNITFANISQSYADTLGAVSLHPAQELTAGISLVELYGGPAGDIPGFAAQIHRDFPPFQDIQSAVIAQGVLRVTVANNCALAFDSVAVVIEDAGTAAEIGRVVFAGVISPAESRAVDVDLSGAAITGQLAFSAYVRTPGGYVESVAGNSIEISAHFPEAIAVTEALAVVPKFEKTLADTIEFTDDIQASAAEFSGGQVLVHLGNGSNLDFSVNLILPDLTRDGVPLAMTGTVAARSTVRLSLDLTGTSYSNDVTSFTPLRINAVLFSSGSVAPIAISSADRIAVTADIEAPVVESVTGTLPATVQPVEDLQAEIDLPEGFAEVGLAAGELQVEVVSSLPYPGAFDLLLTGDRQQSLQIAGEFMPAAAGVPLASQTTIANAATLLSPIPALITAAGTVTYGDGITSGTARSNDFILPSFRLTAPLSLYLDDVEYSGEVEGVALPGESDDFAERFGAASISAEFDNHLPFGVVIEVRLAGSRADLPNNPDLILGPTEIAPASVDVAGRTSGPVTSRDVFSITAEQSGIFEGDSLFITEELRFFSSDGSLVTVRDSDYVDWRALLRIEAMVGDRAGENR